MKSKLRILAITLIMVLSFGLVSVNADATAYGITVNGVALTSEKTSVDAGSGTVSYDATAKELTLKNATISCARSMMDAAIVIGGEVTIKLVGTNTITNTATMGYGINAGGKLTITGNGSLSINAKGQGIFSGGDLTVKNTTLNVVSSDYYALMPYNNLVIDNSVVDLQAPTEAAIYESADSVTIKNVTGKILQASNDPITASTAIISDPSTFDKADKYHYVKISNKDTLSKIAITLKEPVIGETPATTFTSTVDAKGSATPAYTKWLKVAKDKYVKDDPGKSDWEPVGENEKFQKDYYYAFTTIFERNAGYKVSDDFVATVNGKEADFTLTGTFRTEDDEMIDGVGVAKYYGPLTEAEKAKSPATGDNNELGLFAVAGLISVAGVAFMLRRKHSM